MTYKTNKLNQKLIPPHGGYRSLKSYQMAEIIYDLTVIFCNKYKSYEQMTGAARSGKQNIAEGSTASGTSKKTELKLVGIARGSLEELLQDYEDFLRQNSLPLWGKDHQTSKTIRSLSYQFDKSSRTYMTYISNPETAANCLVCLINQANYLLDKQLSSLEKEFLEKGGFTERLYNFRKNHKTNKTNRTNRTDS